jgi:GNAT superfamily N-acetyltransferase
MLGLADIVLRTAGLPCNSAWMRWRPVRDDSEALADLFGRVEVAETGRRETKRADVRGLLAAPGLDLESRTCVVESGNGRLHGFAALHPAPQAGQLRAHMVVAPGATAHTARTLLRLLDEWVADDAPSGAPVTMFQLPRCLLQELLTAQGWAIVHSYTRLSIDLNAADIHEPAQVPGGVRLRAATGDLDRHAVHAVLEDAMAGHWNHQRLSFADFDRDQRQREGYDPNLWLLAEVDGVPAGAVIARDPAERAWIAWLGVVGAHRGRGISTLLLHTAFKCLRQRGHHTVGVDVDTHNSTGAVSIYKGAGMAICGTADQWRKIYA